MSAHAIEQNKNDRTRLSAFTWDLFGPANQNQQLPVQEVTQGQQGAQAAVIGRIVLIGSQWGGVSEQQVRNHLVS